MNAIAESIRLHLTPMVQYVLRIGDTCLIHAQRLAEWCGHGPVLEEDIALTNLSLDLLGQARALLTHAAALDGQGHDEDRLAFLRDERGYLNLTLVEQPSRRSSAHAPGGDFADVVLRNLLVSTWFKLQWQCLAASSDSELAAIAGKAVKEARYHVEHAAQWAVRLGDGTEESHARMQRALDYLWPYTAEFFSATPTDEQVQAAGIGPAWSTLAAGWEQAVLPVLEVATLKVPAATAFLSRGKEGRHSEHMGHLLAEMQYLQRAYPGAKW